ncbi:cyanoglobin [Pseudogemmobacter sp. CC-YST710]|uniref:Cyanoglobin n=2 Tax=Pseudogemmobacter faecipullorum TaxID=2755041 RepID=A0ABS8CPS4_9RHOB|nr:cyanoglobin [Pseudogemmobacter faecipullorum]MCB5411385.1 cyanoglobin [Pseudogemmobacter faecipullorum]
MLSSFEQIGGEDMLRRLVDRFYDLIETDPRGRHLLLLHHRGHGLAHAREEQFNFLAGFLGGPRYYAEKYGHMDVKQIHAHVPIRSEDAVDWLALMDQAISDCAISDESAERMRAGLRRVAMILVNTTEPG